MTVSRLYRVWYNVGSEELMRSFTLIVIMSMFIGCSTTKKPRRGCCSVGVAPVKTDTGAEGGVRKCVIPPVKKN